MRHWLWYKVSGEIGGDERITGGWNPALDFNDPASTDPTVQTIRALRVGLPDFGGFIAYECDCALGDPECPEGLCSCPCARVGDRYVAGGVLTAKPGFTTVLDGAVVPDGSVVQDKTPGASVALKLTGALPDGATVQLRQRPGRMFDVLATETATLTFASGETNEVTLIAPVRGAVVDLALVPGDARHSPKRPLRIRGW